jgi:hypothetical protein
VAVRMVAPGPQMAAALGRSAFAVGHKRCVEVIAGLAECGEFLLPSRGTALVPTDASYVSGSFRSVDAMGDLDAPGSIDT